MKKKKYLTILLCLLLSSLFFYACSNDDEGDSSNNSFIINGKEYIIYDAACSFHEKMDVDESYISPHGSFTMQFSYDESLFAFHFSIFGINSSDAIRINEDFVSKNMIEVTEFREFTTIGFSTRYNSEEGKLSIIEKGSNYVIVNFDNFSFIKDTGKNETKYTINGKVKFFDINK